MKQKLSSGMTNYLKSIWAIKLLGTFAIIGSLLFGYCTMKPDKGKFADYNIELLSINALENVGDLMVVEGTLQSMAVKPLADIKVVISWYGKGGDEYITSGEQFVERRVLKQYETSTFRVTFPKQAGMEQFKAAFKQDGKLISLVYSRPYKSVYY